MEDNMILVYCDTCECKRDVAGETITVVQNVTYNTYTYTYFCVMCGSQQVHDLDANYLPGMFQRGCRYQSFEMPILSFRPGGPPLDQNDLNHLAKGLANNDYLAAYA